MPLVLRNIREVLKPNGVVLFRDYATGDLAQERLTCKDRKISENFYVRGDGTRAFYFSEELLMSLFKENGFDTVEHGLCCKQVENRSRDIVMNRRWVQAVFCLNDAEPEITVDLSSKESAKPETNNTSKGPTNEFEIDISKGIAADMFGVLPFTDEIIEVNLRDWTFKMKVLPKEYQHTCKSTCLILWESATLMSAILASNQSIVEGKNILELGSGCGALCTIVATQSANLVVATDGDEKALDLLAQNLPLNLQPPYSDKLIMKKLYWGDRDHIANIKKLSNGGFDVVIGTDITYIPEAILPLFETAKELLSVSSKSGFYGETRPALILCHIFRRVDESSIISAASRFGFKLVDKWPMGTSTFQSQGIIDNWFSEKSLIDFVPNTALNIMYFHAT